MADHGNTANEPKSLHWTSNQEQHEASTSGAMGGPSMFDETDDDYMEPGETAAAPDAMDAMIDQYLDKMAPEVNMGQLLSVPVVAVKSDGVLVDVGDKSEGFVSIREFPMVGDKPQVKPGDVIDVIVKGPDPETGLINLSHREARRRKAWIAAEESFKNHTPIQGIVTRTVKGGLIMDIGTTAFLPASQIDLQRVNDFESWLGKEVEGFVIEFAPEKRRIIVSRRQMLEGQLESRRRETLSGLTQGQTIEAKVKRVVEFGAFVELGAGLDGLVPRSEISWQRNARPEDYVKAGQTVTAKVIEIDQETGKVTLSRRLALANPWDTAREKYPVGSTVSGEVVSLTSYGAFVRLDEGLDGMIHISDMAWDAAGKKPSDYVAAGQQLTATVLNIDTENRRISLGMKQLTADPWDEIEQRYPKGKTIKGAVTGLTKYGAFVELEPGIEGMIHVTDFSWDKKIRQPRDAVKKGDEVEAMVLEIDRERRRISLGVKQMAENPLDVFLAMHRVGDTVEGEVTGVTEFGAFVKLADNIEGFMHVSQMDQERVDSPKDVLKTGDKVEAKITKIDRDSNKISLSRRQLLKDQEKKTISAYMSKKNKGSLLSMGELLEDIQLEDVLPAAKPEPPAEEPKPEQPSEEKPLE
ncbi:MAG: 30S ribosomal protein S1 [Candidatus Sumerlaeia bacterium]